MGHTGRRWTPAGDSTPHPGRTAIDSRLVYQRTRVTPMPTDGIPGKANGLTPHADEPGRHPPTRGRTRTAGRHPTHPAGERGNHPDTPTRYRRDDDYRLPVNTTRQRTRTPHAERHPATRPHADTPPRRPPTPTTHPTPGEPIAYHPPRLTDGASTCYWLSGCFRLATL